MASDQVSIREANGEDRPNLVEAMRAMSARIGNAPRSVVDADARIALMLATDHDFWMVERAGEAIGYAILRDNGDHVYLRHLFIAEAARRRGAGRAALALLDEQYGHAALRLDARIGDERAQAFWRAMGFAPEALNMRRAAGA